MIGFTSPDIADIIQNDIGIESASSRIRFDNPTKLCVPRLNDDCKTRYDILLMQKTYLEDGDTQYTPRKIGELDLQMLKDHFEITARYHGKELMFGMKYAR